MVAPRTILLVEDNALTRKMLRLTLESDGYSVVEAADGRGALAAVEAGMPGLVVQDLVLPDMSGFDLLERLRAAPGGRDTPIVAVSGFMSRFAEHGAAPAQFNAVLLKPVKPSRLLEVLRAYCPEPGAPAASFGAGRRLLLVHDDPLQLEVARARLADLGFVVATASSSVEGLRAARAQPPDVIVAEALMPELDGFELCLRLRREPVLAGVPVVLVAAWHPTESERALARRAGASDLVAGAEGRTDLTVALGAALRGAPPEPVEEASAEVQLAQARIVVRQLERRVAAGARLARRCSMQAAEIALLGGVSDALAKRGDWGVAMRDVLSATLDAAGMLKGALFLRDPAAGLVLRSAIGLTPAEEQGLGGGFGQHRLLDEIVARQAVLSLPAPGGAAAAILDGLGVRDGAIVPLVSEGQGVGAMILAARHADVQLEDAIAFARAIGSQLVQALALARSIDRLAASELRYRTVTESASDAIAIMTPDGVCVEVNQTMERALGLPRARIVGRRLGDFEVAGPEPDADPARRWADRGAPRQLRRSDGVIVLMEFATQPVTLAGEELVFAIGRNVTERVSAQAQLMASDRMASVGLLAAGVAHEVNNPLAAVTSNLDHAGAEIDRLAPTLGGPPFESMRGALRDARAAADVVRTIVRDLMTLSRADEDETATDVERVLEWSLRLAGHAIRHRARIVRDYQPVAPVAANEPRLGQVFLNLILNASQALPDGKGATNEIQIRTRPDGPAWVLVEVEDNGCGIPPEVMARLFTPFVTTKAPGVGTGLGLSICRDIIAGLGGTITAQSSVGRGSIFRVRLRAQPGGPVAEVRPPAAPAVAGAVRGKVLVVDDEPLVGRAVWRILSNAHDVRTLTQASEALAEIVAGARYDLILCDLMMPVMTGADLYHALASQAPDQAERLVFMTGSALTATVRDLLDSVPNPWLIKPFDVQRLKAMVDERLRVVKG
jgi:PAS domain S-box-containing protein